MDNIPSNGCAARRVKCDETKPDCLRCTSTRRVCDGYLYEPCVDPSGFCTVPPALTTDPSAHVNPCALSKRSFAFFMHKTSPQLAGLFGSAFWERLVLQVAHYEPAIRHAITAIGSLHEQHIVGRDSNVSFALQQYNLAIRSLLAPPPGQQRGLDVSLISCILFTCFEVYARVCMSLSCRFVLKPPCYRTCKVIMLWQGLIYGVGPSCCKESYMTNNKTIHSRIGHLHGSIRSIVMSHWRTWQQYLQFSTRKLLR